MKLYRPFTYGLWLWYVFGLGSYEATAKTTPVLSKPSEAALPPGAAVVHGTEAQSGGMGTGCLCFGSERPCHGEDVAMKYHEGICMLQRDMIKISSNGWGIAKHSKTQQHKLTKDGPKDDQDLDFIAWSNPVFRASFFGLSGIKPTICIRDLDGVAWAVIQHLSCWMLLVPRSGRSSWYRGVYGEGMLCWNSLPMIIWGCRLVAIGITRQY